LKLPLFPSTTIGSFPQTDDVRQLRANLKKGTLTLEDYESRIKEEIISSLRWQEDWASMCWYMVNLSGMIWWNILGKACQALFLRKMAGYKVMVADA
jgi:hypothetical protein